MFLYFYVWLECVGHSFIATAIPFIYSFSGNSAASAPISTFMCLWAIYIFPGSVYIFPPAEQADPSWNIELAHRHMNVEIGTEAPIFLFWEYLFQIFGILSLQCLLMSPIFYFWEMSGFEPRELPKQASALPPLATHLSMQRKVKCIKCKERRFFTFIHTVEVKMMLLHNVKQHNVNVTWRNITKRSCTQGKSSKTVFKT